MKIKLVILLLSGILFFLSNAQAEVDSLRIFKKHSLQFRVSDFISLSSFKGALLSYKYHSSDKSAYRLGLSVEARKINQDLSEDDYTGSSLSQDRDSNRMYIEFMAEYLRYLNPKSDIKIFAGIGPRIEFTIDNYTSNNVTNVDDYRQKRDYDHYQIGLILSYGLELFFWKNLSLHAEYGCNVSYIYYKEKNKGIRNNQTLMENIYRETTGFEFMDRGVLVGLSVYF